MISRRGLRRPAIQRRRRRRMRSQRARTRSSSSGASSRETRSMTGDEPRPSCGQKRPADVPGCPVRPVTAGRGWWVHDVGPAAADRYGRPSTCRHRRCGRPFGWPQMKTYASGRGRQPACRTTTIEAPAPPRLTAVVLFGGSSITDTSTHRTSTHRLGGSRPGHLSTPELRSALGTGRCGRVCQQQATDWRPAAARTPTRDQRTHDALRPAARPGGVAPLPDAHRPPAGLPLGVRTDLAGFGLVREAGHRPGRRRARRRRRRPA